MNINNYLETLTKDEKMKLEKALILSRQKLDKETFEYTMNTLSILIKYKAKPEVIISCLLLKVLEYKSRAKNFNIQYDDELILNIINRAMELNDRNIVSNVIDLDSNSIIDFSAFFIRLCEQFNDLENPSISHSEKVTKANNILKYYRPISKKMKLNYINSRLEDLCLYYINPTIYNMIFKKLNGNIDSLAIQLEELKQEIETLLNEHKIDFEIKSRVKNYYSIYEKILSGKNMNEIFDVLALRIISSDTEQCYKILGLLQQNYRELPNRLKDYITNPKENNYQSIHTTMCDDKENIFEIQIRDLQMNKVAEEGSASHTQYKQKSTIDITDVSIDNNSKEAQVLMLKKMT